LKAWGFELELAISNTELEVTAPANLSGTRVLLIEANRSTRHHIENVLRPMNTDVHSEQNVAQALNQLRESTLNNNPYDLVLFNAQLPDMPGEIFVRCMRLLRTQFWQQNLP